MATYTTNTKAINAVIKLGKEEEGYLEKASNANLDSKTANAGYNNYTKYWRDLTNWGVMWQPTGFAGGPDWSWCAGFICWIFCKVFGIDAAKLLLLHMPFISCPNMASLAAKEKRLYTFPKKGDIVLFWNGTRYSHTGYVYKVTSTTFYTIEGNTNASKTVVPNGGEVCLKSYSISVYTSKGTKFFRPDYSLVVKKDTNKPSTTEKPATNTTTTNTKVKKVKVNTAESPLNCRNHPSTNSVCVGTFAKGAKLTLVEKTSKTWWKVKGKDKNTGKTVTGYCATKYLKEV